MPPIPLRPGGPLRRLLIVIVVAAAVAAGYAFDRLGPYLAPEEPLVKGDAIFVLAGTRMLRPLEGADLYNEGYAPLLVMTRDRDEVDVYEVVARRGLPIQRDVDRARDVFVTMGMPASAILIPDRVHDSTAAEAITLRELARERAWRRVIVVTSKFHLRRAAFAVRRELEGTGVEAVMRGSRYDRLTPARWWTRRAETRWVLSEFPKLVAYLLGMGA
jgi:uncharacterized SAM-binding protein YcdF (DUF218 family)